MIKRRFYKLEHSNRDAPSQSSSSSSDFELDAEDTDESEEEQEVVAEVRGNEADCPASSSSGYESDSSAHELNLDSSGVPTSDDDGRPKQDTDTMAGSCPSGIENDESVSVQQNVVPEDDGIPSDIAEYAVKRKSVFKCRLCPRIVCLTMETIRAHLKSKRHARSEKLLKEGRLKVMLDDNGKLDDDTDTESAAKILYKPPKKPKMPRSEMNSRKFDKKRGKSRRPAKNGGNKRRRSDS